MFYASLILFMAAIFGAIPFTDAMIVRYVDDAMRSRVAGIRFLGTGGIGGVHRGYPTPPDVSGDLVALVTGKATAKALYQHGQLRVDGDVSVAHRLGVLKGLI